MFKRFELFPISLYQQMFATAPKSFSIFDHLSLLRMDLLKTLGQKILPIGHWEHQASSQTVYLTFDDGPSPYTTDRLLDLLANEEVSATFFLIGKHADKCPKLVENIATHGHTIGSHSFSHKVMPFLNRRDIESEIHRANNIFGELLGEPPRLFRPPYGLVDQRAAECLNELGMTIVYWGSVPEDWGRIGAERVAQRVLRKLSNGTIVVLHEQSRTAEQTLAAARQIIRSGKARGFRFKALEIPC